MRTFAYWLMIAMVFTLPWEGEVDVPGVGQISRLVGVLAAMAWLLNLARTGQLREPHPIHILGLLFVVWNGLSLMWTFDGAATQERVFTYAQLLVLMLIVWDTVRSAEEIRQALLAYLAGCYVTVTSLLVGYATEGSASEVHGRVTVGGFHPNDVGMILAIGVPIAGYILGRPGTGVWRHVQLAASAAYLPLAGFAVLVTGSRAGLAAMLPGALYLGYVLARRRPAFAVGGLAGLIAVGALVLPLVPTQALTRLEGTGAAVQAGDLNERTEIWAEAVRIIEAHPLVGIGSGAFESAAVGVNKVGHNFALALLAEGGVVGFGLFLGMLVVALLALRRQPALLRGLWVAVFSAWLFAALLHNWEYRKQTWFMLAMMVVCGELGRSGEEDGESDTSSATADHEAT
jgi:O-antigen ligase